MVTELCRKCKQAHPGRVCDYDEKGECAETIDTNEAVQPSAPPTKEEDILVIGQEQKCVYHPYDGGGDIIVRNDEARTALKQMFSAWLSPRADGL